MKSAENTNLIQYYKNRANEYEQIYLKPERQNDITKAKRLLKKLFNKKELIEIACGTGYWTEAIALTASALLATDINQEVLNIALTKKYPHIIPEFKIADIYDYVPTQKHEALFGGFIWSHIELKEINRFIDSLINLLIPGGLLVLMDNLYVEGSSHPISETDRDGNTFQLRKLNDGTMHRVLKNFPGEKFLLDLFSDKLLDVKYIQLNYFWILTGTLKS